MNVCFHSYWDGNSWHPGLLSASLSICPSSCSSYFASRTFPSRSCVWNYQMPCCFVKMNLGGIKAGRTQRIPEVVFVWKLFYEENTTRRGTASKLFGWDWRERRSVLGNLVQTHFGESLLCVSKHSRFGIQHP